MILFGPHETTRGSPIENCDSTENSLDPMKNSLAPPVDSVWSHQGPLRRCVAVKAPEAQVPTRHPQIWSVRRGAAGRTLGASRAASASCAASCAASLNHWTNPNAFVCLRGLFSLMHHVL